MTADRLHPIDRVEDTMEAFVRHSRGEILFVESEVLTKDGRRVPVNINTSVVEIDGKPLLVGMFRDDTERRRAEGAYRTLVEKSLQGLVILQNQSIEFASPSVSKILGFSNEELVSLPPEEVDAIIHHDDRSRVWKRYRDRLDSDDPVAGISMVGGQSHVYNGSAADPQLASLGVNDGTRSIGALWMGSATQISREDLLLLTTIGEITTNAIHQATLFDDLERSNLELGQAYETTLEGWSRALELRCHETEGHTKRVAETTVDLARSLGMDDREIAHIRRGALLHDIGKIAIPDAILMKPGRNRGCVSTCGNTPERSSTRRSSRPFSPKVA